MYEGGKDESTGTAVILLLKGGGGEKPEVQFAHLIAYLQAAHLYLTVEIAFVDHAVSSLPDALERCGQKGARRIVILPLFVSTYSRLSRWLAKVILRWRERGDSSGIEVVLADPLEGHPALGDVVASAVNTAVECGKDVAYLAPADWANDPDEWSFIPPHRYHVFTCQGPRCTARGAGALWAYLMELLEKYDLCETPGGVLVSRCDCQYPCNLGPLMTVYPDGIWYCHLDREAVERIVEEHFRDGKVVSTSAQYPYEAARVE